MQHFFLFLFIILCSARAWTQPLASIPTDTVEGFESFSSLNVWRLSEISIGLGVINDNGIIDGDDYGNTLGIESWISVCMLNQAGGELQVRYENSNNLYTRQELGITHITSKGTKRFYDGTPNNSGSWYRLTYETETDLWDKYKDQAKEGRTYVSLNNQTPISVYRHTLSARVSLNNRWFMIASMGSVRLDHGKNQLLTDLQSTYHFLLAKHDFNNEEYVRSISGLEENATYLTPRVEVAGVWKKRSEEGRFSIAAIPSLFAQKNISIQGSSKTFADYQLGASLEVTIGGVRNKNNSSRNLIEFTSTLDYDPNEAFPKYYDSGAKGSIGMDLRFNFFSRTVNAKGEKRSMQISSFLIPFGITLPIGEGGMNSLEPYDEAKIQQQSPEFTNKLIYLGITFIPLYSN